ncbi:ethanolamine utilization protein [Paenibacillus thiaminolyticus]|uniref:Ethanolamine utilization protein n=1 Tax=Paenibacillus thiaminolyticus TaxID=49283 RepID=A0AAP9J0U4_PANTH|nr:ethanolamine utilization protein [Paenibacillus thiaminolyticus]MCY9533707.1 ethanolamine utilization protein [Paenibacillus thiaminolyticus]MCY9600198.1 ethanolamine utilization protein [Paenibacillus thiaminolyticus]MCY9607758.1 ethanolamine utilization protein [Paenibacillus thiaminolyticus]MCY9611989.1 ethanolamine utilization protein [Paenibacillus thiaminolyticus]MCY9617791.1 ethanolamine utilization protein [Paenibacillus thiaminolyticus]
MNMEAPDRAALIEAVAAEVLKRLRQASEAEPIASKKQAVLLAAEPAPALESVLQPHYDVCYYDESLRDCDLLLIPKTCIQLLSNLANGISAGPRERFVLTLLLKGRKVVLLEDGLAYRKYKPTAPVLLYKLYDGMVDKLRSYGIHVVKQTELPLACLEDGGAAIVPQADRGAAYADSDAPSQLESLHGKVITEAELKKCRLQNRTEIVIDRHAIITPLAQDYMRTQQMRVHRR